MPKEKERYLGKLPPKYTFILNPYAEYRFTRCPNCNRKMKQRKLPLFIHVDPCNPVALNKTCRYCPDCDLLIAHQDEIESLLVRLFAQLDPGIIGNDYLVVGTVERPAWRESMKQPKDIPEMLEHLHDFQRVHTVKVQPGGWYPAGLDSSEMPVLSPGPLDTLWKKQPRPLATPKPQRTKRKGRRRGRK